MLLLTCMRPAQTPSCSIQTEAKQGNHGPSSLCLVETEPCFFPPCRLMAHFLHLHGAVLLCVPPPPHTARGELALPCVGILSLLQAQVLTLGAAVSWWFQRFWLCHVVWWHPDGSEKPRLVQESEIMIQAPRKESSFPCQSQVSVVPGSPLCVRAGQITTITHSQHWLGYSGIFIAGSAI